MNIREAYFHLETIMAQRTNLLGIGLAAAIALGGAFTLLQSHAQEPAKRANEIPTRYAVSTEVLPGHLSMTLFYITDAETDKLYIYRATGGMTTSLKKDPELYRTYDLSSVGAQNLKQAE
jgi:hypothetical protein